MPFYEGDLRKLLDKSEPYYLEIHALIKMLTQISEALQFIHSLGIAHGDISPKNILYRSDGNEVNFYLADFGNSFFKFSDIPTQSLPYRAP